MECSIAVEVIVPVITNVVKLTSCPQSTPPAGAPHSVELDGYDPPRCGVGINLRLCHEPHNTNVEDCQSYKQRKGMKRVCSKAFTKSTCSTFRPILSCLCSLQKFMLFLQSGEHALYGSKMACFCSSFSCISHSWSSRACHIDCIHCSRNCITVNTKVATIATMDMRHDSPVEVPMLSPPVPRWWTSSACKDFDPGSF